MTSPALVDGPRPPPAPPVAPNVNIAGSQRQYPVVPSGSNTHWLNMAAMKAMYKMKNTMYRAIPTIQMIPKTLPSV